VSPYGDRGLVHIADDPVEFIRVAELELRTTDKSAWLKSVDDFLSENSWDETWSRMMDIIRNSLEERNNIQLTNLNKQQYV
jgi:UDP-galactopyranose mutase